MLKIGSLAIKEICPVCKSSDIKMVKTLHRGNLVGCNSCHHLFSHLQTDDVNYNETVMGEDMNPDRFNELTRILENFNLKNKNVVDLGCGTGVLLAQLNHKFKFYSTSGVELSNRYFTATRHVDTVYHEDLILFLHSTRQYDVVFMFHIIEHIKQLESLEKLKDIIYDDGYLFVEVPHRGGSPAIPYDYNLTHLHQFSIQSISSLIYNLGFEIIYIQTLKYHSLRYSDSVFLCARKSNGIRPLCSHYSKNINLPEVGEVVIWGCASPLIEEMLEILKDIKIVSIVDSNKKMQGKYIYNILVQPPDVIERYNNTNLLINSLTHSEEIKEVVNNKYKNNIDQIYTIHDLLGDIN